MSMDSADDLEYAEGMLNAAHLAVTELVSLVLNPNPEPDVRAMILAKASTWSDSFDGYCRPSCQF